MARNSEAIYADIDCCACCTCDDCGGLGCAGCDDCKEGRCDDCKEGRPTDEAFATLVRYAWLHVQECKADHYEDLKQWVTKHAPAGVFDG